MSEHNKGIKVGDLITAYNAGFHRVTRIQKRFWNERDEKYYVDRKEGDEYNSLIYYKTVMTAKFSPSKGKAEKHCDAGYCEAQSKVVVERWRKEKIAAANKKIEDIKRGADIILGELK